MEVVDAAARACHYKVRWSPPDAAWIASVTEYPGLESSDGYSRLAAINGLRDRVKEVIAGGRGRQMPSRAGMARPD